MGWLNDELVAGFRQRAEAAEAERDWLRGVMEQIAQSTAGDEEPGDMSPRRAGWEAVQLAHTALSAQPPTPQDVRLPCGLEPTEDMPACDKVRGAWENRCWKCPRAAAYLKERGDV